ncbi:outer membrane beta-barrel protein [Bdellovibrio sp. HCB337]|uniref:outer membrane beta-barrel protein n=1 Tax=Bdellovibrio sp. HCB337 TaxID=3394358 RepID=UPI0039A75A4A
MKKAGLLRFLFLMSLGVSMAHASDLKNEIDTEAALAMKTTPKAVKREPLVHLAPVGGITFAKLKGTTSPGYSFSTATGYEGGVGILIGRGSFQFETGVMYAERSTKESYSNGMSTWDLTYQNKYIELPLMVRWNVMNNSDIRLYVKGGGVGSLLQSSTGAMSNMQNYNAAMYPGAYYPSYYGAANYNSSLLQSDDTKSAFSAADFRWAAGIGGQIRVTKSIAVLLEGDYQTSLNPVSNTQPNGYFGSTSMNLSLETYGIKAGVLISL